MARKKKRAKKNPIAASLIHHRPKTVQMKTRYNRKRMGKPVDIFESRS